MNKVNRQIEIISYLLKKLLMHVQANQHAVYKIMDGKKEYLQDWRITSFGYQRAIVYCALNDCVNFESNVKSNLYKTVLKDANENFSDDVAFKAIVNYPIFNFIIRYSSILETGAKNSINKKQYDSYKEKIDTNLVSAHEILRQWRNTIHKNGILDVKKAYLYTHRNQNVYFYPDEVFKFSF